MKTKELEQEIREWISNQSHQGFDQFIMKKMGVQLISKEDTDTRWKAYKKFVQEIGEKPIASVPTMKRWFGIGGNAIPSREVVFSICFALHLGAQETEEFLVLGLREPSFQINDYIETIYLYGLENGLSQDECDEMAATYEKKLENAPTICHTRTTQELMTQYQTKKNLSKQEFLCWMSDNAKYFKGYSKTVLDYILRYKKLVIGTAKEDAQLVLNTLLEDTEFYAWKRRRMIRETNLKSIRRFIYSKKTIQEDLRKNILELAQIVYSEQELNSLFVRELFSFDYKTLQNNVKSQVVLQMTEKRLSDLLGTSIQRERQLRSVQGYRALEVLRDEDDCPDWLRNMFLELCETKMTDSFSVAQAKEWLKEYQKKQKRRCLLVQRGDILPMVCHMAQKDYLKKIAYNMDLYDAKEAYQCFEEVANATLSACNMALLDNKYELDSLFSLCFQKSDMYTIYDVLDELRKQQSMA